VRSDRGKPTSGVGFLAGDHTTPDVDFQERTQVKVLVLVFAAALSLGGLVRPAHAQSRPLVTEDPETVPAGHILLEGGLDLADGLEFPFTGLEGTLWRIGVLGASIGVGPVAELQVDWGLRQRLNIEARDSFAPLAPMLEVTGDTTSDALDLRVGSKFRLVSETEGRPAIAARFWTDLPVSDVESGLGSGVSAFHAAAAVGKTIRSVRLVVNLGLGSIGNAVEGHRRHTVVDYGGSLARALRTGLEAVGELAGQTGDEALGGPPASTMLRLGGRITRGPVRVDAGLGVGLNDADPAWGFTVGATLVFRAFETP
jgi:hypothetical protein